MQNDRPKIKHSTINIINIEERAELGSSAAIVAALLAPLLFLVAVAEARYIFNLSRGSGSALHLSVA